MKTKRNFDKKDGTKAVVVALEDGDKFVPKYSKPKVFESTQGWKKYSLVGNVNGFEDTYVELTETQFKGLDALPDCKGLNILAYKYKSKFGRDCIGVKVVGQTQINGGV